MSSNGKIPIIDFDVFLKGDSSSKLSVSKDLVSAVKTFGFVYLKTLTMSKQQIDEMFELSRLFFQSSLPLKHSVAKSHETFCGYDAVELEKLSKERPADYKESFMINQFGTPWPAFYDPTQSSHFKLAMLEFHQKCFDLGFSIFTSLLLGLDVETALFDNQFSKGECTIMRLLHYPPMLETNKENQLRCGEHTDYGALSFLFQDSVGGLEIKTKEGFFFQSYFLNASSLPD